MRELSNFDQRIIDAIINRSYMNDLRKLQIANILREELNIFAWEWNPEQKTVTIFSPRKGEKPDFEKIQNDFLNILNYLYLIETLVDNQYVRLMSISSKDGSNHEHYDITKYEKNGDEFWDISQPNIKGFVVTDKTIFHIDCIGLINDYLFQIAFPLESLADFQKRGYLTEEQKHRREEIAETKSSVSIARKSAILSLFATICAAFTAIVECESSNTPTDIADDDINKIEEAIYSQHSIQIENLNQIPRDTMTIVNCPRITISTK